MRFIAAPPRLLFQCSSTRCRVDARREFVLPKNLSLGTGASHLAGEAVLTTLWHPTMSEGRDAKGREKPSGKKRTMKSGMVVKAEEFRKAFAALKTILKPYERKAQVSVNRPDYYNLVTHQALYKGKPLYFAGVRAGKAYVSFHLFPLYRNAKLAAEVSPELQKRKQGKTCFDFTSPDPALFRELARLSAEGFACLHDEKFVSNIGKHR
jgi:hypothetical protein